MAAADEANPLAHPDALRRKRTLRDAGLAAKATSFFNSSGASAGAGDDNHATNNAATTGGGGGGGGGEGGEDDDDDEGGEAPWIGRRVVGTAGHSRVVVPERSTAPMSLGSRCVWQR